MLTDKALLVTGVARPDSIAYAIARRSHELGARVALTAFPRDLEATRELARTIASDIEVWALDLTDVDQIEEVTGLVADRLGGLDGAVHAVAFAPRAALAGPLTAAPPSDVELAFRSSTWTLAGLARILAALAPPSGGSLVGLDFDSARAWPVYHWMGVCKAALRSTSQYLARDLGGAGIRVNLVAAGPLHTRAAGGIPDFDRLLDAWATTAPLAWDPHDPAPIADAACFLLSDMARAVTGEVLHVDGGHHAMAAPLRPAEG